MILCNDSEVLLGIFITHHFYVKICNLHDGNLHEQVMECVQNTSRSEVFIDNCSSKKLYNITLGKLRHGRKYNIRKELQKYF